MSCIAKDFLCCHLADLQLFVLLWEMCTFNTYMDLP